MKTNHYQHWSIFDYPHGLYVYDNVNVFYEPPPALSASYIQPMVWHHSISYQFSCTCVLCVTQREHGMTMKFRTLLHVCSTAVLQSTLTTVISLGSSYRELKTLQDGMLCCVQMFTALHHSAPAQIEFLSEVVTNE